MQFQSFLPFIFRKHPLPNKQTGASGQINESDEEKDQDLNINFDEGSDEQDMIVDEEPIAEPIEEPFDFEKARKCIFVELFSAVMKTKILHSVANEAIDELLIALKTASEKSNLIFKKKFKEAIKSQLRK